jgi:hypothetical protein
LFRAVGGLGWISLKLDGTTGSTRSHHALSPTLYPSLISFLPSPPPHKQNQLLEVFKPFVHSIIPHDNVQLHCPTLHDAPTRHPQAQHTHRAPRSWVMKGWTDTHLP